MSAPVRVNKLRPGDDTVTYCGRCKDERAHQIVALNADAVPAIVICRTCGNQHRYRDKKEPSSTTSRGTTRRVKASSAPARHEPVGPVRAYSAKEVYSEGEWIDHTKFGQGKVVQSRGGKIEVRFESGSRILVQAG